MASASLNALLGIQTAGATPIKRRALVPDVRSDRLVRSVSSDGFCFAIRLDDNESIRLELRELGGSFVREIGRPYSQHWIIPVASISNEIGPDGDRATLLDLLGRRAAQMRYVDDATGIAHQFQTAREEAIAGRFNQGVEIALYGVAGGGTVARSEYNFMVRHVAVSMHARWHAAGRFWLFKDTQPESVLFALETEGFFSESQIKIYDGLFEVVESGQGRSVGGKISLPNCLTESSARTNDDHGDSGVFMSLVRPIQSSSFTDDDILDEARARGASEYQEDGVVHLASKTSAALFDDMGLGKTRTSIIAARIVSQRRQILVGAPASALLNWQREIHMAYPEDTVAICEFSPSAKWIVVNYEQMDRMLEHAKEFEVAIWDEAHLLKEPSAQRTQVAFALAAVIPFRYILTGTPVLNREVELYTLLRLSGHPIGELSQKDFVKNFAGSPQVRYQLNQRLKEWMLRRRKELVLKNFLGKQIQPFYVTPLKKLYGEYWSTFKSDQLSALQKMTKLRMLLERMKVENAIEFGAALRGDDKVIYFCEFQETVDLLKTTFESGGVKVATLTGAMTKTTRQANIDQFQQDPDTTCFVTTTAAGGVAITLTAANYVYFLSLPWTSAAKDQAEDRASRRGQARLVLVKVPLIKNTIDEHLYRSITAKRVMAAEIIDPEAREDAIKELVLLDAMKTRGANDDDQPVIDEPLVIAV